MDKYRKLLALVTFAALVAAVANPSQSQAKVVFNGSGTGTADDNIAARATFEPVTYDFGDGNNVDAIKITLENLSDPLNVRGNLLTSLFFATATDFGNLDTTSTGFDGLAATVIENADGSSTSSNVDIAPAINMGATDGTYQLSNGPFGTANDGNDYSLYDYGIATVGMGLTGFSGSAVNGDDYGIASAGTVPITNMGLQMALPVIDQSAMFWLVEPEGFTWSEITDVRFGFGSLPDNTLVGMVPEASSVAIWSMVGGLGLCGGWIKRRRKLA